MTKNEKALLGRLKKKKRDELFFIIEQLIERKPDIIPLMELLIELPFSPLPQQGKSSDNADKRTLDLSNIQKQTKTIINKASRGGRDAVYWATAELGQLCEIGDNFVDAGQWANAQAVYATIAGETIVSYEELEDECQIAEFIDGCTHGLVLCLDTQHKLPKNEQLDAINRKELLASLFNIWEFERNYGGITIDVADAIVRNLMDNEYGVLEEWVQQKISPNPSDKWRNQGLQSFLAILTEKVHKNDL